MKIALYLGSFNPFHNGHLKVIETALYDFKIDKVVIVPTMQNPSKKEKALDIDKRLQIIKESVYYSRNDIHTDDSYDWLDFVYHQYYIDPLPAHNWKEWNEYKTKYISIDSIEKTLTSPYYSYATLHALKNKYCNDEIFILCGEDTIKDIPNWMNGGAIIQDYNFLVCDRPKGSISSTEIRDKVKKEEDISDYVNDVNLIKKYYQ